MDPRIAIATCSELPQLTPDDAILRAAIERCGMDAVPVVWNDADVDWESFDGCLVRSVWDYHRRLDEFLAWAGRVDSLIPFWNGPELIRWNARKPYLREIEAWGIPTIPTRWLKRKQEGAELAAILAGQGWEEAVIKPEVDLGALNLHRVRAGDPAGQVALDGLLADQGVMVQPYLPSLDVQGELSIVFIEGRMSHAVQKRPAAGDFRVQARWGGTFASVAPSPADLEIAESVISRLGEAAPLYARVDLVGGLDGERCLIELELIEPNLFLRECPETADRLARGIAARLLAS